MVLIEDEPVQEEVPAKTNNSDTVEHAEPVASTETDTSKFGKESSLPCSAPTAIAKSVKRFLWEPAKSSSDIDLNILEPLDGSVPRIKTPLITVQEEMIEKQIIVEGKGKPPEGHAKCFVHFLAWVKDSTEERIEDTRSEKEPVQIVLGKDKPHLQGVAVGLRSMRPGERSLLHINWKMAYGEQGNFSFPHVAPRSDLIYDIELFDYEPEDDEMPRADMTFEERCRQADKRRLAGNELFKDGNLDRAISKYTVALSYFGESFMFQLEGLDKYKDQANAIRLPIHLNLAACYLKKGQFSDVVVNCTEVLNTEADNVKALYRRGSARLSLGQTDVAKEDLQKAHGLAPEDKAIIKELHRLKTEEKGMSSSSKNVYGGLFGETEEQPATWRQSIGSSIGKLAFWRS